ncbi:hypothetical protein EG830_05575, partial [bacterium]|nr:hypothetical protein [bacterium]
MKRKIRYWIMLLGIPLLLLAGRNAYAGPGDFQLTVRNISQTAPNVIEFDLYLLDTDPLNDFYLSTEQFGILFNSSIYAGGTISATISNTGSGLGPFQLVTNNPQTETNAAYSGQTLILLAGNMAYTPLAQCTLISKTNPGTLITHFILTSTVNFASGTTPNFVFTSSTDVSPLYATRITVSDGSSVSDLTVTSGVNATVSGNPVLNAAPDQPGSISGSAVQCSGAAGQSYSVGEVTGATSYTWTLPAGWTITSGDGTNSIAVTVGTSGGTVSVTASNANGTSPASALSVTVNQTPVIPDQNTSANSGEAFSFTPAGAPGGTTYTWPAPVMSAGVTGGVAQLTGVTSISGTLSIPSGSGTATYTVTPANGTCIGSTFTVTVNVSSSCVPVDITVDPVNTSMCAGGNGSFSVTATGTTPAFQWQYYNGTAWVSVANGTPAGAVYTNAATAILNVSGITAVGIYQYRCTATNCIVSTDQSAAATLTVNAIPAQPDVNVTQPTCSAATGTITVNAPADAGMTYSIDGITYTNTTGIFSSVIPGGYTVTARSSAGCVSPGRSVTVNPQPLTPVVGNQTASINTGQTFTVTPAGVPIGTTYTWTSPVYTNGVTGGVAQATGVASISGTLTIPSGSGTATYTVTPATPTCTGNPFTVTVTVTSTCIPVDITADPVNTSMCVAGSVSFSVAATGTTPAFQW